MRAWLRIGVVGLCLALSACAYKQAMSKGDALAAAGDWEAAYAAYEEAVAEKPDSEEAQIARQRAKDHAVEEAVDAAQTFLVKGAYEDVIAQLDKAAALDRDRPEVFDLRLATESKMADDYARLWEMGEAKHAYTMASRTKKLFPEAAHLKEALPVLRAHYIAQAEGQLEAEAYEDAMTSLGVILEYEPDRQADVVPVEQRVRSAWATAVADEARTLSRQRKQGAAALTFTRAYEIAGRSADLEEARKIGRELADDAVFTYRLQVSGERDRSALMRAWLEEKLGKLEGAAPVTSRADLTARITIKTRQCSETDAVTKATKDFVSGQIEVDNPDHIELTGQVAQAREAEATAISRGEELFPEVESTEAALVALDARIAASQKTHDTAKAQLDMATTQLDGAKGREAELNAELTQQQATGAMPGSIETTKARLVEAAKRIGEWNEQVETLGSTYASAKKELDALNVERGPLAEALTRLKSGYEAVVKDRTENAAAANALSGTLARTPKTVMEDVVETLAYDIHDYERTCLAPVSAAMTLAWRGKDTSLDYTPLHKTADRAHIGHAPSELAEDPKLFPDSDDQLLAKGDDETRQKILDWLSKLVGEFYTERAAEVRLALSGEPVAASTDLVSLYLGAASRLDEATVSAFEAHAKLHFDVEKLELLKSGATSTEM